MRRDCLIQEQSQAGHIPVFGPVCLSCFYRLSRPDVNMLRSRDWGSQHSLPEAWQCLRVYDLRALVFFSCGCVCGVGKIEDTAFRVLGVFVCLRLFKTRFEDYIKSSWHFLTSCEEWNSFRAATFLEVGTQDDKPTLLKPSFSEKDYLSLSVSIPRILRVDHAQIFESSVSFF